jgi:hypothetical protein
MSLAGGKVAADSTPGTVVDKNRLVFSFSLPRRLHLVQRGFGRGRIWKGYPSVAHGEFGTKLNAALDFFRFPRTWCRVSDVSGLLCVAKVLRKRGLNPEGRKPCHELEVSQARTVARRRPAGVQCLRLAVCPIGHADANRAAAYPHTHDQVAQAAAIVALQDLDSATPLENGPTARRLAAGRLRAQGPSHRASGRASQKRTCARLIAAAPHKSGSKFSEARHRRGRQGSG